MRDEVVGLSQSPSLLPHNVFEFDAQRLSESSREHGGRISNPAGKHREVAQGHVNALLSEEEGAIFKGSNLRKPFRELGRGTMIFFMMAWRIHTVRKKVNLVLDSRSGRSRNSS